MIGAVLAAGCLVSACNYHWYPLPVTYQLQAEAPIQVVSAVPAVEVSAGHYAPQCTGEKAATSVLLTLNILGSNVSGATADKDTSMRVGDFVKTFGVDHHLTLTLPDPVTGQGGTITTNSFELELDCIEAYPDKDLTSNQECSTDTGVGSGLPGSVVPIGAPSGVDYQAFLVDSVGQPLRPDPSETGHIGVAVLIDQSGSMKGRVDLESFQEVDPSTGAMIAKDAASDLLSQRVTMVEDLVGTPLGNGYLNPGDRAIVFAYGEQVSTSGAKVMCQNTADLPEEQARAQCYGTDRSRVDYDRLNNGADTKGRTPLWAAVKDAYEFMRQAPDTKVRHVVVIGDGPDTCAPDSPDFRGKLRFTDASGKLQVIEQGLCSAVGYRDLRDEVLADLSDASAPRVHVSFIQIQAPGYKDRDPLQQEVACLTGGQYVFINSEDLPKGTVTGTSGQAQPLREALGDALHAIRYTFAGSWRLAVDVPSLVDPHLPRGAEVGISGVVTLKGSATGLKTTDEACLVRVGQATEAGGILDKRVSIRLPCAAEDSCAWLEAPACGAAACADPLATCKSAPVADGTACDDGLACTTGDACVLGVCGGKGGATGTAGVSCDDHNPCTNHDSFDATGRCWGTAVGDGTACNDGNSCTMDDVCASGVCIGNPDSTQDGKGCDDHNPCTNQDTCANGVCQGKTATDNSACPPFDACFQTGTCQAGVCENTKAAPDFASCGTDGLCLAGACIEPMSKCP